MTPVWIPSEFKSYYRFASSFGALPDLTVEGAIADAQTQLGGDVGPAVWGDRFKMAVGLLTAHLLFLYSSAPASGASGGPIGAVSSVSIDGEGSQSFATPSAPGYENSDWGRSGWGVELLRLQRSTILPGRVV